MNEKRLFFHQNLYSLLLLHYLVTEYGFTDLNDLDSFFSHNETISISRKNAYILYLDKSRYVFFHIENGIV